METKKLIQSKILLIVVLVIVELLALALAFKGGEIIGYRKAGFFYRWGENYERNFGAPKRGPMHGFGDRDFAPASGLVGQIIKINEASLVIKDRDNTEKIVVVNNKTTIQWMRETVKLSDLKVDQLVVVIGEPEEQGQVEAKLIRVMPAPGGMMGPIDFNSTTNSSTGR